MCARHPGAAAVAACRRCGTFVCASDQVLLENAVFCGDCAARPDVDYLEAFRLKFWGKRDAWAWFYGVQAVGAFAMGLSVIADTARDFQPREALFGVVLMASGVIDGAFWWGARWARGGLVAAALLFGLAQVVMVGPAGLGAMVFPMAFAASALNSVRTKLFFKMDVDRGALKKAWAVLHDNVIARYAVALGVCGFVLGIFAPLAVLLGVLGLRRVDPAAYPPVGRKGQAIAGIVLGALGTLGWGAFAVALYLGRS